MLLQCTYENVSLRVGGSKGKAGIQIWCIPGRRDTNNLYPGKWWHSLYRHNKTTIDCGFEFVNIESITLSFVTKCFLTGEPLLIVGLNWLMILSLWNWALLLNVSLWGWGFWIMGARGVVHNTPRACRPASGPAGLLPVMHCQGYDDDLVARTAYSYYPTL